MKENKFILFLILLITTVLRVWDLSSIPPHPSLDESSIGYNAYSILKTGKDEFGEKFPVLLRAYDDYRPAHYTYLVVPFVKLLGPEVLSVRLPSALLSIATVFSVYVLAWQLFIKSKYKSYIALASTVFFAISPWHIYMSRLGHEVNLFFSMFIFGITFFYLFLTKKGKWYLFSSAVALAISFSSYQSGKIFVPAIILVLFALYYKQVIKRKPQLLMGIVLFMIISLPMFFSISHPNALIRLEATSIYSELGPHLEKSAARTLLAKESGDLLGQVINNRRLPYIYLPASAYISHFDPFWLFTNRKDDVFKAPNLGLLNVFELPLILFGVFFLFKMKIGKKNKIFLLAWIFLSIIPGALTTGYPHAMRIYQVLPSPHILSAVGLLWIYLKIKNNSIFNKLPFILILFGGYLVCNSYFVHFPKETAHQFQYGINQALKFAEAKKAEVDNIYVSNKKHLFQSYMFYLFFNRFDPSKYQILGGTVSGGFDEEHRIGKYFFGDVKKINDLNSLYIINPDEIDTGIVIKKIYSPEGRELLWIVER